MARITVEDCLEQVDNRFQLVMMASKRARQLQAAGKEPLVPEDNDKPSVIALREIAEGLIDKSIMDARATPAQEELPEADLSATAAMMGAIEAEEQAEEEQRSAQESQVDDTGNTDDQPDEPENE